ncbi:calcium/proton exchanger [Tanacetum coccineum]
MQDTTTNKQIASPTTAGAALRLFFHDCLVEGCDASVLISSTHFNKAERDADINLSLPGDGFDVEMVALTGAHTIGFSHCSEISHDIYNYSRTQMSDPSYNTRYADGLRNACKDFKKNPSLSVFNDIMTPHDFDNSYYKNLPKGLGVLRSDRAMMMDVRTRSCTSCEPKRKKAKKDVFTVNLYYDGLFTSCPMIYFQGQCKVLTDTNFDEMTYVHLLEILKRLVPNGFEKVYYCKSGAKLTSIREIKSDQDIVDMLKVGYDNGFQIDMYVDHFGYDIMEMVEYDRNEELRKTRIKAELDSSDDDYHYSDDDLEEIENVDFHTEGDDSVVIKNITTQDPFLTKLCSARVLFRGHVEFGVNEETPQVDPDDNQIDPVYKVKKGVVYPAFDPDIPWDKMEPILGMRFETPHQLKMALANYGVAHGYQLWYMKNDWRQVLVYCGRNIDEGRCAGKKGNKHRVLPRKVRTRLFRGDEGNQASKKPVKKPIKKLVKKPVKKIPDSQSGEGTSKSPKWTKKQILNSKKVNCPFRLYASWMSREHSFQIKSLRSEHKCCRNYNLGSLVTYKWIAVQYFKEIIKDPFIPLRKMRDDIRQKFMIDVSVGQCKRAKQLALFDHEGGLIEHYAKLYQYRQAILDSNPGSTCTLDVVESDNGSVSFKRMYICFKGVKDGWLAGCRKVLMMLSMIGLPSVASRGGGRSGRGDGNDGSGSGSGVNAGSASGGRGGGRAGGSGGRGGGRAGGSDKRGGGRAGRGSEKSSRGGVFPSSSSSGILTAEQEYQLELDEQAFRECIEEQARE